WGTVCDDSFDSNAATVVCRMLGYTGNLFVARTDGFFGAGSGSILLDDVTCNGNETSIVNCRHNPWGQSNCGHNEDVGVDCQPNIDAQVPVRLVNGSSGSEGRVEIQHGGLWGTVCDDEWDDKAASIVCRQLQFSNVVAIPLGNGYFGAGSGNIWLDDVKCQGGEAGLGACAHKPWGQSNCAHTEDAGVMCIPNSGGVQNVVVRLTGGLDTFQGRVEINVFNRWGTICDDGFDDREANVICRMLNHPRGGHVLQGTSYAGGTGPIWLDDMECMGNETDIRQCVHKPWGVNNCGHSEDVAVQCVTDNLPNIQIRLAGGPNSQQGRVEIQYNGQWGTVCDDHWSASDAAVACRMLGLPFDGAVPVSMAAYGNGSGPILMDDVECVGTEATLAACRFSGWTISNCDHTEDAAVICQQSTASVQIRLSGGSGPYEGRLEVNYNGTWGTVCDDSFDTKDGAVVCRQLGYPGTGVITKSNAYFGQGSGPIWLDDLDCTGLENNLIRCGHRGWGRSNCGHSEDASVICPFSGASNVTIRLVGGSVPSEGRVEVFHSGQWGTVCDDYFDTKAAQIICNMLGYPSSGAQPRPKAYYGNGTGQIWLDNVQCAGNESRIDLCRHNIWGINNCNHGEDVGVLCVSAINVRARLVNGSSTSNGRLELYYNGTWGTVCDDGFGSQDAQVICHMLGFQRTNSMALSAAPYGSGTGPILLDDVQCLGLEDNIVQCRNKGWYTTNCDHTEDVGVVCNAAPAAMRLVNGTDQFSGRVEIFLAGQWGTVCDDFFDNNAAK
ncbi:hypothetical protein CHS0354_012269, partial [Potamilus streckersoni]